MIWYNNKKYEIYFEGSVNKTAYRRLTQEEQEERWQSLTISDDFLFCKILSDMTLCAEMLHRIFPDLDVRGIKPVKTQKSEKLDLHIRGVRFDVFTSIAKSFFDAEMQKRRLDDVFKRPRAYQTVITYRGLEQGTLKKSGNYKDLPDAYVVFICNFDPFRKGRHIYSFQNYCTEDKEIALGDGAHIVYLNTKGKLDDVSPALKRFLDFVGKNKVSKGDSFIETLDRKVKEAKKNTQWRHEFMMLLTIEDEKFAEGRAEGLAEGKAEGRAEGRAEGIAIGEQRSQHKIYERLISSGKFSPQEAAEATGWNANSSYGMN